MTNYRLCTERYTQSENMENWSYTKERISSDTIKYQIKNKSSSITNSEFISLLTKSDKFINSFSKILISNSFEAYFWEVKPFSSKSINNKFEFVLVKSSILNGISADNSYFKNYFKEDKNVVSFLNLGKDAKLIVPTHKGKKEHYNHLANFMRNADNQQIIEYWKEVGNQCNQRVNLNPIWISTAGLGVNWLHLRIDSRPKYYKFKPYKIY